MINLGKNEKKIHGCALHTLNHNTHTLDTGNRVIFAGGRQFRTLWVRDFCYSVDGLLGSGQASLVKFQLALIHSFLSKDGFLPRGLDIISPKWRVVQNTVLKWLPIFKNRYPTSEGRFKEIIKAEYFGEHQTPAMDSNALFVLSYITYGNRTSDWFIPKTQIKDLLDYYNPHKKGLLFDQPPFSDWQDSVLRKGPLALLQLQILAAYTSAAELTLFPLSNAEITDLENQILESFFDSDSYLFYQDSAKSRLSLDCYGFIFRHRLFKDKIDFRRLYGALKNSPLWKQDGGPGVPVYPPYLDNEVSWTTKAVGLRHYHDGFHWGWLIAEAATIAKVNDDHEEYLKIVDWYASSLGANQDLAEIYLANGRTLHEYAGILYRSEKPFTWTAAKWLTALYS